MREWGQEIIFLYRILPGRTDRSYGIHVAKIAGLPRATVERAAELLETLSVQTRDPARRSPGTAGQMSLFTEYLQHPVLQRLREMDLTALTPLEAFDALRSLQDTARDPGEPAP